MAWPLRMEHGRFGTGGKSLFREYVMSSRFHGVSIVAVALIMSLSGASAQVRDRGLVDRGPVREPALRGGFFGTLGLGGGRERYRFSDDPNGWTEDLLKPTVTLRLGGTPNENLRLGGELFGWGNSAEEGYESFVTVMITGQYYPIRKSGLYLKGGIGYARSGTEFNDGGSTFENGFGHTLGLGLDIALSSELALSPGLELYQGGFARRGEATLTERVVNIGVSLTWQNNRRR